ncbi:hypothetical protein ACQPZJ_19175 [Actinoplanes sp. CA-054009]
MTKISFVVLTLLTASAGACARPVATVPAGCEPTTSAITWSPATTVPVLTSAWLYEGPGPGQRELPAEPFEPAVTGVAAPSSWLTELAASLARETGRDVHTTSPTAGEKSFGFPADGTPYIIYSGADRVTADFEVRCDPAVRGTLTGWYRTVIGGASCGENGTGAELDAFGRRAVELCAPKAGPAPSASA